MHFPEYVKSLESATPGTAVVIPLNPGPWTMTLIKH
jgi:hypothetical protein